MTVPPAGQSCSTCTNYYNGKCCYSPPDATHGNWVGVDPNDWCSCWGLVSTATVNSPYPIVPTTSSALAYATASSGLILMVSDGQPGGAWGDTYTYATGGTTPLLIWSNGSDWTIIGK